MERTHYGGSEIVKLKQTGSAYFAPASSTRLMVESILRPAVAEEGSSYLSP